MHASDNAAVRVQILAAQPNAAFAEKMARALEAEGYEIAPGDFDPKEVDAAVILWSGASIASPEMINAAALPLACSALIPVSIGRIEPPPAFRHLQAVDLAGWTGTVSDPRWRFVTDEIDHAAYAARLPPGAASAPASSEAAVTGAPARSAALKTLAARNAAPRATLLASFAVMGVIVVGGFFVLTLLRDNPAEAPPLVAAATAPPTAEQAAEQATETALAAPKARTERTRPEEKPGPDELAALIADSVEAPAAPPPGAPDTEETERRAAPPQAAAAATAPKASPSESATAPSYAPGATFRDCATCPEMTIAPAGRFSFGSPPSEPSRQPAEGPVMVVEIAKPFAIGAREVTHEEWAACVAAGGCTPEAAGDAGWGKGKRPVINVSWDDAESYARWLSAQTGAFYRLPSEAEWEYAARAGAETAFSFGALVRPSQANFDAAHPYGGAPGAARGRTAPVGSYAGNAFGLYDMHGNVWEWVADCWTDDHSAARADGAMGRATGDEAGGVCKRRVLKGGAWNTGGWRLRAAHRLPKAAGAREYDNGFRVVKELP